MAEKKILIVVDMQKDFVDGSLGTNEAQAIVSKVEDKIKTGDYFGIVCTLDTHNNDYFDTLEGKKLPVKHCIENTKGWKLVVDIDGYFNTVEKRTFGFMAWRGTIDEVIDQRLMRDNFTEDVSIKDVEFEICGLCTDICVVSNALILRATFPDNIITVDASCCAGTTPEAHKAALAVMKSCQIDVINEE